MSIPSINETTSSEIAECNRIHPPHHRPRNQPICTTPKKTQQTPAPAKAAPCAPKHLTWDDTSHLQIGANYTYASIHPHGSSHFSGSIGGLQALYEFKTWNRIYGGLQFLWREGTTKSHYQKRTLLDIKVEERIGYTFGSKENHWILSLFSGLGYRHFGEKTPSSSGSSVHLNYNEFYIPLGVFTDWIIDYYIYLGFYATWMPQVYPTVSIDPLKGARWMLKERLANFLLEVPLTLLISRKYDCTVILKPFFEYWQDGQTTAKTLTGLSLGLPGNTYLFGGAEFNFNWSF